MIIFVLLFTYKYA